MPPRCAQTWATGVSAPCCEGPPTRPEGCAPQAKGAHLRDPDPPPSWLSSTPQPQTRSSRETPVRPGPSTSPPAPAASPAWSSSPASLQQDYNPERETMSGRGFQYVTQQQKMNSRQPVTSGWTSWSTERNRCGPAGRGQCLSEHLVWPDPEDHSYHPHHRLICDCFLLSSGPRDSRALSRVPCLPLCPPVSDQDSDTLSPPTVLGGMGRDMNFAVLPLCQIIGRLESPVGDLVTPRWGPPRMAIEGLPWCPRSESSLVGSRVGTEGCVRAP